MQNSQNTDVCIAIESALQHLLTEKPFHRISVSEIAQKAGVARASFYRHYSSPQDAVFSSVNRLFSSLLADPANVMGVGSQQARRAVMLRRCRFIRKNAAFFSALARDGLLYNALQNLDAENMLRMYGANILQDHYLTLQCVARSAALISEWVNCGPSENEEVLIDRTLSSLRRERALIARLSQAMHAQI